MQKAESSDQQFCGMTSVRVKPLLIIEATFLVRELIQHWKSYEYRVQLPKLVWLRTEEPQAYAQVQQFFCQKII